MVTEKDIRTAIDQLKEIKASGHYHYLYRELEDKMPTLSEFIYGEHKRTLVKNEKITLFDFACVVFLVFKNDGGIVPRITLLDFKIKKKDLLELDPFNEYLTECEVLEDYLKPVIYANEFIRPKNAVLCISIVCAVICRLWKT